MDDYVRTIKHEEIREDDTWNGEKRYSWISETIQIDLEMLRTRGMKEDRTGGRKEREIELEREEIAEGRMVETRGKNTNTKGLNKPR